MAAMKSGTARGQAIMAMTAKKNSAKGRSTYAKTVAEEIKFLTLSKPWMLLTMEPAVAGR